MIRRLLATLLAATGLAATGLASAAPHIVLVGDSTVTDNAGWGLGFRQFLADGVELTNTSQGGRSSMSFIKEGRWEKALALKADYYLIQFGHNDQPGKPGRSTTPEEFRETMTRYVDEATAAGAQPVLVTSLVRREFRDKQNPDRIDSSLEPWAETVRMIAREKNVPLVELHDRSKELCESMGREGVAKISPVKPDGQYDGTHLNSAAYVPFGRIVAQELEKAVPALAPFILAEPRDPRPRSGAKDFDAVVSFDGSGTHPTVQAAIDAVPADTSAGKQFRILVKPGVYKEHVVIPADKKFIQLMGEPGEEQATVITMGTNVKTPDPANPGKTLSAQDSSTVLIDASDVTCRYLTFENTTTREDRVQALACFIRGDRVAFFNCRFLGWQDTLRPDSWGGKSRRQYFRDCYVEGHCDYIYAGGTAVFDRCTIHTKADGYITAASTAESTPFGFVFLDCKLTAGPGVDKGVYLGRPWRPAAHTAFIRCEMDDKILPAGWHNWGKAENEATARYYEFGSTGPGARSDQRVPWAKTLTEAEKWSAAAILNGNDSWNPLR
jgi:pectinesterase